MQLIPSIICADQLNLERDLSLLASCGIKCIHIDIMDGCFVPRYGFFPENLNVIQDKFDFDLDIHLMIRNPDCLMDFILNLPRVKNVSVHFQPNPNCNTEIFSKLSSNNIPASVVVDLYTHIDQITEIQKNKEIPNILFMGIIPGILNQNTSFEFLFEKIEKFKERTEFFKFFNDVSIDGSLNFQTFKRLKSLGINSFVCGSQTIFKDCDSSKSWPERASLIESNIRKCKEILYEKL